MEKTYQCRQNDYEHWVKCICKWEGYAADMSHDYISDGGDGVIPIDHCPNCGSSEENCVIIDLHCPECGQLRKDDDRVKNGMKCGLCAY